MHIHSFHLLHCKPNFEVTKGKSNVKMNCGQDRLSELPDSLIFEIFDCLPMSDVVRTTILSKRWKDLWTTCPYLDFNISDMKMMDTDKIPNFIDRVLNSWRGIKIVIFIIKFPSLKSDETQSIIDKWIRFATEKKVEKLHFYVPYLKFVVPRYLYSCSSLKDLWLSYCDLQVDGNVQWYRLKTLFICGEGLSENAINQVMLGSPHLETFFLFFREINENLSIRSTSLKRLAIRMLDERDARVIRPELRIWTPNLETLGIHGIPYSKCLLMDVSSLAAAYLKIDGSDIMFPGIDFVGETMSGILPSIKHVQIVKLSSWCIKAIGAMKDKHMLSPFPNAEHLELNVYSEEYEQIVGVLEMFPNLTNLVLQTTYQSSAPKHAESSLKFDSNLPNMFLLHLSRVDVTWTIGDDSMFPLVQFLLKFSRNLETMVFLLNNGGDGDELRASWKSLASQKLQQMERSSPTANLIFR